MARDDGEAGMREGPRARVGCVHDGVHVALRRDVALGQFDRKAVGGNVHGAKRRRGWRARRIPSSLRPAPDRPFRLIGPFA